VRSLRKWKLSTAVGPLIPIIVWIAGLLMAHHPMILSGLDRVQGDLLDSRFVNYILEHGFRWVTGAPGHRDIWSPPFFYPARNAAAYSDTMIGTAPLYWCWRRCRFAPDTSFQLWMFTVSSLNFLASYLLLKSGFRLGTSASSLGAFFVAFNAPRMNQLMHPQLLSQFESVFTTYALIRLFTDTEGLRFGKVVFWAMIAVLGIVTQLYAGFYLGWFFILALGIASAWACILPSCRGPFQFFLKRYLPVVVWSAAFASLLLLPLFIHSWRAKNELGDRSLGEAGAADLGSWVYLGPESWLWGRVRVLGQSPGWGVDHERRLGVGVLTPCLCAAGLYIARRCLAVRLVSLTALTLFVCVTTLPGGFTAWNVLYQYVPGASALRAVSRAGLVVYLAAAVGLAFAIDSLRRRRGWGAGLACVLALVCALEQGLATPSFEKRRQRAEVAAIADKLDGTAEAFLVIPRPTPTGEPYDKFHVDAMWAGLFRQIPTVNGYSGWYPPDWAALRTCDVRTDQDFARVEEALANWSRRRRVRSERIQRIVVDKSGKESEEYSP